MEKKPTKREMFTLIATLNADNSAIVEFCNHEIELLDNKKANGKSKTNSNVDKICEMVYASLERYGKPATASELIAQGDLRELANENGIVTSQKIATYLNKLVDSGRVKKSIDKKKSFFEIA